MAAVKSPNSRLRWIFLDYNEFDAVGAVAIGDALKNENCKVAILVINGNAIGPSGATSIASSLTNAGCALTSLSLMTCAIGDVGAVAIANSMRGGNSKVAFLNLGDNEVGNSGASAVADLLKHGDCIVAWMGLFDNAIGSAGAAVISESLKLASRSLRSVNLNGNPSIGMNSLRLVQRLSDQECAVDEIRAGGYSSSGFYLNEVSDGLRSIAEERWETAACLVASEVLNVGLCSVEYGRQFTRFVSDHSNGVSGRSAFSAEIRFETV